MTLLKNNRLIFNTLIVVLAGLTACKNDPGKTAAGNQPDTVRLAGRWVAIDFVARAEQYGSVLGAMNHAHAPYAYCFEFKPNMDSVICYNGFEEGYALPVRINIDTIEVKNAVQGKSVFLVYEPVNKELVLFNTTSGRADIDRFMNSKYSGSNGEVAFHAALNAALFDGTFNGLRKGSPNEVKLQADGSITNLPGYDRYELCVAGDCFVGDDKMDIIMLKNSQKSDPATLFSFYYGGNNDTLTLYNVTDPTPDDKGGAVRTSVAYQWLRKKNPLFQPKSNTTPQQPGVPATTQPKNLTVNPQ